MENACHNPVLPEATADAQAIAECIAARMPVPPEVARRGRERADQARKLLLARHGVQDIGVQFIREIRGGLPQ